MEVHRKHFCSTTWCDVLGRVGGWVGGWAFSGADTPLSVQALLLTNGVKR